MGMMIHRHEKPIIEPKVEPKNDEPVKEDRPKKKKTTKK